MRHLLTLAASLVLALPPGSCGFFPMHGAAETQPVQAGCCRHLTPQKPGEHEKLPAVPVTQCCCARDATLPEKSILPAELPLVTLFTVAAELAPAALGTPVGEVPHAHGLFGPRLHVLQCVWLC